MIYMFLSNNPSSGDIDSSNLPCLAFVFVPLIKRNVSQQFMAIFGKLNFEGISTGAA